MAASRKLNKGERQKLFLLLGLFFVVANLIAISAVKKAFHAASLHVEELKAQEEMSRAWLGDRDLWTAREAWLKKNQPKLAAGGQANVVLLETLQKAAGQHHLTIVEQSLKDAGKNPYYQAATVQLHLTGSLEAVCRWMASVQQPELFQEVTDFSLKSEGDADNGTVRCDLTVSRLYSAP